MNKLADNCKHILQMHMNQNWEGINEPGWLEHRFELFKKYTLPSILNQTNRDFIVWIWWRDEEKGKYIIRKWGKLLRSAGLDFVFTYNTGDYFGDCATLKKKTEGAEWLYVSRLDTDDLIHKDFMDSIQGYDAVLKRAILPNQGYVWNIMTDEFREHNWYSPPYFTIIYPRKIFFDDVARNKYANLLAWGHSPVRKQMASIVIPKRLYIHTIHEQNAGARDINAYTKSKDIIYQHRVKILKLFGL